MNKVLSLVFASLLPMISFAGPQQQTFRATMCAAWDGTFDSEGNPVTFKLVASIQNLNQDQLKKIHQNGLDQALAKCRSESSNKDACRASVPCVDFTDTRPVSTKAVTPTSRPASSGNGVCYALAAVSKAKCEDHFRTTNSLDSWAESLCDSQAEAAASQCR